MIKEVQNVIDHFTEIFGKEDCFRTWVDNINNGEKYVVWCSMRCKFLGARRTFKYRRTVIIN
jgi:hypothetical protein